MIARWAVQRRPYSRIAPPRNGPDPAALRDRTAAEKKAGHSVDQAVATVTAAFGDRAHDQGPLMGAIKAAYAEAQ